MLSTTTFLLAAVQTSLVLCAPSPLKRVKSLDVDVSDLIDRGLERLDVVQIRKNQAAAMTTVLITVTVTAGATTATSAAPATGDVGEEDEEAKTRTNGTFGTAVTLKGANELQAVSFTGSMGVGAMEIEYQANTTRTLTVTENTTPGAAPAGFKFADASSYRVALAEGSASITRQQIDYVFNLNNAAVKAANISAVQTGKLCTETNSFIISTALGTQDFEDDEGESTFLVKDIVGEWAVFLPSA